MDVSFGSESLAALCNSERRMAARWGQEVAEVLGRRLLDLAASTAGSLERIPTAAVAMDGKGKTTIRFMQTIVVKGVIQPAGDPDETSSDDDAFVIESVEVQEDDTE